MSACALAILVVSASVALAAPSPGLLALDKELDQQLQGVKAGSIGAADHVLFVRKFRPKLDSMLGGRVPSSEDVALHSLILSRLGARENGEAVAALDAALANSPDEPALLKARGQIHLEGGDFTGAAAAARAVLKGNADRKEPPDPEALRLFHASNGRAAGSVSPLAPQGSNQTQTISPYSSRVPVQFSQTRGRAVVDVPSIGGADVNVNENRGWSTRTKEWALDKGANYVGRMWHAKPEEEKTVRDGVARGGVIGAGVGGVGTAVFAVPTCGPAVVTGAGYAGCVGAAVVGGTAAGTFVGGFVGGSFALGFSRLSANFDAIAGKDEERE